jgi:NAD(P)-dependent dehydrogenase (short-subunit alcohol dehydrogenase family)
MQINHHTFLVTGGASGLGAACVRQLAANRARVVIIDRDNAAGESLARELGADVVFCSADVTQENDIRNAIDTATALSNGDGLRGAINCAGIAAGEKTLGKTGPHSLDTFTRVININLIGTFNVARLAAEAISQATLDESGERGVIIHTASISAFEGQIGQTAYAASKGGVTSMTLPMARDLAPLGIRVVTIAPGVFETPLVANFPPKVQESLKAQTLFPPRLGQPDEFAALARHIIENPMLNGCTLRLDGATRLPPR